MTAPRPLPLAAAVPLAVLGGVLTDLAFPGVGLWPLAPVGVAALVLAVAGRRPRAGALLGLLYGLAFFVPHLAWAGIYVGLVAWLPLATLEALFAAALGAVLPLALRCPGGPAVRVLVVAGLWVAAEAARARLPFGGLGWGRLAFSQSEAPAVGLAALGGAPLVSFAVAAAGAALALAVLRPRTSSARSGRGLVATAALLAAAAALTLVGAAVPRPSAAQDGSLAVAAVQGNVPRAGLEFNAERRAVLDNHAAGTQALADRVAAGRAVAPDVVVWPENASDIDPLRNRDARAVIDDAASAVGAPVLVGAVLRRDDDRLSNTTLVWEPGEGPVARYDKRRPVPFAEYVPYRSFFRRISSAVDLVARDFVPGGEVGLLDAAGTPLGVLICFEVVEDDLVADTVRSGAELVVVQTNNATFGRTDESVQQLAMSRLRAVEHGRAVVHVSTVGVSALIAPDGSVLSRTELFTPAVLQASLPRRTSLTPATRTGAWPEAALAAAGLLGGLAGALSGRAGPRRGSRRPGPGGGPAQPRPEEVVAR